MTATLQEAFGVASFVRPESTQAVHGSACGQAGGAPLALRGNIGPVRKRNDTTVRSRNGRWSVPGGGKSRVDRTIVREHARGGAEAAWRCIPRGIRGDMMRYVAVKKKKSCTRRTRNSTRRTTCSGKRRKYSGEDINVAAVAVVAITLLVLLT